MSSVKMVELSVFCHAGSNYYDLNFAFNVSFDHYDTEIINWMEVSKIGHMNRITKRIKIKKQKK